MLAKFQRFASGTDAVLQGNTNFFKAVKKCNGVEMSNPSEKHV